MEFREITLLDQEPIGALRAAAGHVTSSHAFVSLYLWRKTLSLSVAYRRNAFLVRMGEKSDFFFPCGEREDVLSLLSEIFSEQKDARFFYARKEDLLLASHLSEKGSSESFFTASEEEKADTRHLLTARRTPEAREYLYDRAEQIAMPGKRFAYQRAKCNKARRLGLIGSLPLSPPLLGKAEKIARRWAEKRRDPGDLSETLEALALFSELGLSGNMLFLDGEPVGFQLGSYLSPDTYDIHIAKTLADDVDPLMKWELYRALPERVVSINREEDLGIPGLALHKADAQPAGFHEMFRLSYKPLSSGKEEGEEILGEVNLTL